MAELLDNIPEEDYPGGFDQNQWDEIINCSEVQIDDSSTSELSNDEIKSKQDIVKLSITNIIISFSTSNKSLTFTESIHILIPPCSNQRVRYANECEKTIRYISTPQNEAMRIQIPDLRYFLSPRDMLFMRITRTTIGYGEDKLMFYHPYPIWIKNLNTKIHHGSILIQINETDIQNRFFEIHHLAMIRLKQKELGSIKTLPIFSSDQLDFTHFHSIIDAPAKQIRDEYNLRYSILHFQLIYIDGNNIAHPTNCVCQTEPIRETEANGQ